jgi:DNA-binding GntR family transcriptional regulator
MEGPVTHVPPSHHAIVSAVQATANWLSDRVLNGDLVAGEQVTEAKVAEQFGVSRPTAKSAITILVNNGLLRREANKPASVPQLSVKDIEDLYLVRIPLELAVVRRATSSRHVPAGCARAVEDMAEMKVDTLTREFVETDLRFHRILFESIGSPRLNRFYQAILDELHLSIVQSKKCRTPQFIAQAHRDILIAIQGGDEDKAVEVMRTHLEEARDKTAAMIAERSP